VNPKKGVVALRCTNIQKLAQCFYIAFILSYRRHVGYAPDSVRESDMPTGRFGPLSAARTRSKNSEDRPEGRHDRPIGA
jgi:hypothetical protein